MSDRNFLVYFDSQNESVSQACVGDSEEVVVKTITSSNYIYVGYKKPVFNYYFELKTPNTNVSVLDIRRWNGTSWVQAKATDETKGFKKSNFIYIDKKEELKKTTVNGVEAHWIRISVTSGTTSAIGFNGINVVFCSLYDLLKMEPNVKRFYPNDVKSHILSMCASRDEILRRINNTKGYWYVSPNTLDPDQNYKVSAEDLVAFDVFNIDELRDAHAYLTLYWIFKNRSDGEVEDAYTRKASEYWEKFIQAYQVWNGQRLTLDLNKDGKIDLAEAILSVSKGSFVR